MHEQSLNESKLVSNQILKNLLSLKNWAVVDDWLEQADGCFENSPMEFRNVLAYALSKISVSAHATIKEAAKTMTSWEDLKAFLTKNYSPSQPGVTAASTLRSMKQYELSLQDYIDRFRRQVNKIGDKDSESSPMIIGQFITGLTLTGIRTKLLAKLNYNPRTTLSDLCSAARTQDRVYKAARQISGPRDMRVSHVERIQVDEDDDPVFDSPQQPHRSAQVVNSPSIQRIDLTASAPQILQVTNRNETAPQRTNRFQNNDNYSGKYCEAHESRGHTSEECSVTDKSWCPRCRLSIGTETYKEHFASTCTAPACYKCGKRSHKAAQCNNEQSTARPRQTRNSSSGENPR